MKTNNTLLSKEISENRAFSYDVYIEFKDGSAVNIADDALMINGCNITQNCEMQSFPLGAVYGKILNLALANSDDRWNEYDFYGAYMRVYLNYKLSTGDVESIKLGEYNVVEPETYGSTVEVAALDYMHLTDKPYTTEMTTCTLRMLADDALSKCGLSLSNSHFPNEDYVINNIPQDKTIRNIIGYIAMIAGGFAVIDDTEGKQNKVKIVSYNMDVLNTEIIDGGNFHNYGNLPIYDGGDFTFSETEDYSGGSFIEQKGYHVLYKAPSVNICTDDVQITGIACGDFTVGSEGYILKVENPLIQGKEIEGLSLIYNAIHELKFRPFEMDHVAYPLADIGDCCYVIDRKQREYKSLITDLSFEFRGATTIKCTADSPLRSQANYTTASTMAIQNQQQIVRNYDEMSEEIKNASGSYTTIVPANEQGEILNAFIVDVFDMEGADITKAYYVPTSEVGEYTVYTYNGAAWIETIEEKISRITYTHNKRTLEESNVQWRETATVRSVSTDYGSTWNAAIDASGSVIAQRLFAETVKGVYIEGSWFRNEEGTFEVDPNGNIRGAKITGTNSFEVWGGNASQLDFNSLAWPDNLVVKVGTNDDSGMGVYKNDKYRNAVYIHYDEVCLYDNDFNPQYAKFEYRGSDIRLKENIQDVDSEKILQLYKRMRPVTFNYKNNKEKRHYGLIAQELEKEMLDLGIRTEGIVYVNDDGFYEIKYSELEHISFIAIHNLCKKVEGLQAQIDELKELINKK